MTWLKIQSKTETIIAGPGLFCPDFTGSSRLIAGITRSKGEVALSTKLQSQDAGLLLVVETFRSTCSL